MKKFFAFLIVLLIVGAAGFFLGWAQLPVKAGSYGVMRSKTHGLDPALIQEGDVRWVWYKLIPANVSIQSYTLQRIDRTVTYRGSLPSAAAYSDFSGLQADFSYEISASISFNIKAGALISLITEKNIADQAGLEAYEALLAAEIEAFTLQRLGILGEDEAELRSILNSGTSPRLENEIRQAYPFIEHFSCHIPAARYPDFALYRQIQGVYEDFLAKQRDYLSAISGSDPERQIDSRFRLDELARYGELLTKYPVLLQYLALTAGNP
jgi:hypothetical protein